MIPKFVLKKIHSLPDYGMNERMIHQFMGDCMRRTANGIKCVAAFYI